MKATTRPAWLPRNGFTLVEMMIALALGLLLMFGAVAIYSTQRQTWRLTENLARMQDNTRIAFELLARDVREAGGEPCGRMGLHASLVPMGNAQTHWLRWPGDYSIKEGGLVGYRLGHASYGLPVEITANGQVDGTDALLLRSTSQQVRDYTSGGVNTFTSNGHGFEPGDALMACDYDKSILFEVTGASSNEVSHSADLSAALDGAFTHGINSTGRLGKLVTSVWLVLDNGRGGRSLYRITGKGAQQGNTVEIAEGVADMQVTYLTRDGDDVAQDYLDIEDLMASAANADEVWRNPPDDGDRLIVAVRIALTLESKDKVGTDGEKLQRTLTQTISLRDRRLALD